MNGRYLVGCAVVIAGACSSRGPTPPPVPPPSNTKIAATPPPATPTSCEGSDRRQYGTTCCEVLGAGDDKFPGMIYLSCQGPQIGTACTRKSDCDIACSCDGDGPFDPRKDPQGPPDGTRGVSGRCSGELAVGVWMCQIDESGAVSHVIVD